MLNRLAAVRDGLYARMEEVSFRTSMTVLGGVIAVAAVIAGVSVLMSQSPGPDRPAALSPAPASRSASPSAPPPSTAPSPLRPALPTSAPARTPAPVVTSPAREATYPAAAEYSAPAERTPVTAYRHHVALTWRSYGSAAAAWLTWWRQILPRHGYSGYSGYRGYGDWSWSGEGWPARR